MATTSRRSQCSGGAICRAYRDAVRRCHPDLNPGDASARERFLAVQAAFEVLSDPVKRADYELQWASEPQEVDLDSAQPVAYPYPTHLWEQIVLQRSVWNAHQRRTCPTALGRGSSLTAVKIGALTALAAGYVILGAVCWYLFATTTPGG